MADEKKHISDVDDWLTTLRASMLQQMKEGKGMDMSETMQQMWNMIIFMSMPKMIKQALSDGEENNKFDLLFQELKEQNREREERLLREIEQLKQEKKDKELLNEVERKLEPVKNVLDDLKKEKEKQPDEFTMTIIDRLDRLEKQLERTSSKEQTEATAPIIKELNELRRAIDNIQAARSRGDPLEDLLEQMEKIERHKARLASILGIPSKEADEMSVNQIIDVVTKKGPEIMNSAKSMYDIIKGKELSDDNPIPEIPEVAAPVRPPSAPKLDPELQKFLDEGHEEYIDSKDPSKGKMWVSKYGIPIMTASNEPMNAEDVRKYALAYTDDFRRLKNEIEEYAAEQAKSIQSASEKQPMEQSETENTTEQPTEPPAPEKKSEPEKGKEEKKKVEITDDMLDAAGNPA